MGEKKKITVCPVCGSIELAPYMGFETGWQYECKGCGYIGALTAEVEVLVPKKK